MDSDRLIAALDRAAHRLLELRDPSGIWRGRLCSSSLATAVAVAALWSIDPDRHRQRILSGLGWLAHDANEDGGWGDSPASRSGLAATILALCAFTAAGGRERYGDTISRAEQWLCREAGGVDTQSISNALGRRYGKDRSFAVPILTFAVITGLLGDDSWKAVPALPFELGAFSHRVLKWLRLPVVSYALPALIAIGQVRHFHHPPRCPVKKLIRNALRARTLRKLERIQPPGGGFLEAVPLTGFVAISLASMDRRDCPVVKRAEDFLLRTMREDGSWPIDADLATWVTTLSINALGDKMPEEAAGPVRQYLLDTQLRGVHPFTQAEPGGWAWTDLDGGVPDADDTSSALLALKSLGPGKTPSECIGAMRAGVRWLLRLQNADGGWPTFCRGWGRLPFDRSTPEITAHAAAAVSSCTDACEESLRSSLTRAVDRSLDFLSGAQGQDGAFAPLWFGNEAAPDRQNPVYGTARVMRYLSRLGPEFNDKSGGIIARAREYLLSARSENGAWGGAPGISPTIEETAVALEALAAVDSEQDLETSSKWLVEQISRVDELPASPIGLYFAELWYYERLYPLIFAVGALRKMANKIR
jgi:squalene-hopene/tetraprenyl-beta-curcumene cyclase